MTDLAIFNACPECGERRLSHLESHKFSQIKCTTCGHIFDVQFGPSAGEALNLPPEHPASKEYKLTHGTTKDEAEH